MSNINGVQHQNGDVTDFFEPVVVDGNSIGGDIRDILVNGISRVVDGFVQRETATIGIDPNAAGIAAIGDNRAERVSDVDTAPNTSIPSLDFSARSTQVGIGVVAVILVIGLVAAFRS